VRSLVVTGGGRGIGEQICRKAAAVGYRVGVLDIDAEAAHRVAAAVGGQPLVADVRDEGSVGAVLDAFGPIDALVNNAGMVRFGTLAELSVEDWKLVLEVNLTGTFLVARTTARRMAAAGGGAIVNVASINGLVPAPYGGAYGASKAAVRLLTEQMAVEWAAYGVRVNAVAPGFIDAGMSEPIYADPETRHRRAAGVPLKRLGTAEDVANAVLFLLSDQASYITGQHLVVDGGVSLNVLGLLPRPKAVDSVGSTEAAACDER
jgi:NAD(P)-dependent dehydrogenase (short-subunit alcohol dehydrogenase family)